MLRKEHSSHLSLSLLNQTKEAFATMLIIKETPKESSVDYIIDNVKRTVDVPEFKLRLGPFANIISNKDMISSTLSDSALAVKFSLFCFFGATCSGKTNSVEKTIEAIVRKTLAEGKKL